MTSKQNKIKQNKKTLPLPKPREHNPPIGSAFSSESSSCAPQKTNQTTKQPKKNVVNFTKSQKQVCKKRKDANIAKGEIFHDLESKLIDFRLPSAKENRTFCLLEDRNKLFESSICRFTQAGKGNDVMKAEEVAVSEETEEVGGMAAGWMLIVCEIRVGANLEGERELDSRV
jgi:hypothetical protein